MTHKLFSHIVFQFHIGSIKSRSQRILSKPAVNCFNSTLVQLKEFFDNGVTIINSWFQFHIGSIKSFQLH